MAPVGCRGGRQHDLGLEEAATVETPGRQSKDILPAACPCRFEGAGEAPGRRPCSQGDSRAPEELPVQGVVETGDEAAALVLDVHDSPVLEGLEVGLSIDGLKELDLEWLAEGQ